MGAVGYGRDPWAPQDPWAPGEPSASAGQGAPRDPAQGAADDVPRTRSRSRGAGRAGAGAGGGTGPGRINPELDLDVIDPKGRSRDRAAKQLAARGETRRRRALKYTAWGLAGTMLAVGGVGYYLVRHLLGNVQTVSLNNLQNRPARTKADALGQVPLNILVLGSQTRDGQNLATHVGNASKDGTDLSDTAFLVHISADRKWTEIVSLPRDLFVPIPACQDRLDPQVTHAAQTHAQFYDAMGEGGPACAVATVEQMTNIRVDHFVELTFNAFIQLTDAVGGVQVCVPAPGINDPDYSGLVMSAGYHTVTGNQALAFVRDRHGLAGGTDTQRIRMQQMFMTSLFDKLVSNGTLENPITLYKIAQAVTSNITVDTGLDNIATMTSIAEAVGTIDKKYMQYITTPEIVDARGEFSYDEAGAHTSPGPGFDRLWTYLRDDTPLPGSPAAAEFGTAAASGPAGGATAAPTTSASATAALDTLTVKVYNGTDITGEAGHAAANLKALGMTTSIGMSGYSGYDATTVFYPAGEQAQADALAAQIAGSVVKQSSNVSGLTLVIGTNAPHAIVAAHPAASGTGSAAASASSSPTISTQTRNGDENLCSDLPGVVRYGGSPNG